MNIIDFTLKDLNNTVFSSYKYDEITSLYFRVFGGIEGEVNDLILINNILSFNNKEVVRFDTNIKGTTLFFIINKSKIERIYERNSKQFHDFCYVNCDAWYGILEEVAEVFHDEMKSVLEKILLEKRGEGIEKTKKIKI